MRILTESVNRVKAVLWMFSLIFLFGCSEPEFSFADGTQRSVSEYEDQWLLINYWAVWCKPCVEEIPELNALDAQADVKVLGFNFDREVGEALAKQSAKLGIAFALLGEDPATLFEQLPPKGLPATMVISPAGDFLYWLMGPQTQEGVKAKLALYEPSL